MADDRIERVARAIRDRLRGAKLPTCDEEWRSLERVIAQIAIEALRQPDSGQVREQMLRENYGDDYRIYERYGSNRPRAQWDVT